MPAPTSIWQSSSVSPPAAGKAEVMRPDVDFQRSIVLFRDTKNGDTRAVPLPVSVAALLRERRRPIRRDTDLVFPSTKDPKHPVDLRSGFRAVTRRAKVVKFHRHDQRHGAASAPADTRRTKFPGSPKMSPCRNFDEPRRHGRQVFARRVADGCMP